MKVWMSITADPVLPLEPAWREEQRCEIHRAEPNCCQGNGIAMPNGRGLCFDCHEFAHAWSRSYGYPDSQNWRYCFFGAEGARD